MKIVCTAFSLFVVYGGICSAFSEINQYMILPMTHHRDAAEVAMDRVFVEDLPVPWSRECPMIRELLVDSSLNGKARFHCIDP